MTSSHGECGLCNFTLRQKWSGSVLFHIIASNNFHMCSKLCSNHICAYWTCPLATTNHCKYTLVHIWVWQSPSVGLRPKHLPAAALSCSHELPNKLASPPQRPFVLC
mmetsp:Transcript_72016/g.120766  ORF Transcript_72016/g.120766 Transcript_72016/m.120766 type:complete len:107 (+) Transcript_72016:1454-1774(+)